MNIQELKKKQGQLNQKFMGAIKKVSELGMDQAVVDQVVGILDGEYKKQMAGLTPSLSAITPAAAPATEPAAGSEFV